MNKTIDYFHEHMKPVLRKVQESDLDQTDFLKFNLEKFSGMIEQTGAEVQDQGQKLLQYAREVSAEDDVALFIKSNISKNAAKIEKEEFQQYEQSNRKPRNTSESCEDYEKYLEHLQQSNAKRNMSPIINVINDNYI